MNASIPHSTMSPALARWRRRHFAALVLLAVLLGSLHARAEAAAEKEQFTRLIQTQAAESEWKLESKVFLGKDLAAKGLELTISDVKWDDEHIYFTATVALPADMQELLVNHKSWVFHCTWGYTREGTAEAPVLKLTDTPTPATTPPRRPYAPRTTPFPGIKPQRLPF